MTPASPPARPDAHAGAWGAIWGALGLGVVQTIVAFVLWQIPWTHSMSGMATPKALIGREAVVAMCWGVVLGRAIARALQEWQAGNWPEARRICRRAGGVCLLANGAWVLVTVVANLKVGQTTAGLAEPSFASFFRIYMLPFLLYVPAQASALVWLAGLWLPRREADTVQVTEKLRL